MTYTSILRLFFVSICARLEASCEFWSHFKEADVSADTFCSHYDVESEFAANNQLRCLVTCSLPVICTAILYDRKSKRCARLREGSQHEGCLQDLTEAKLYLTERCPSTERCPYGWTFVYRNCYRLTDKYLRSRDQSLARCKIYAQSAHLADIKTRDQQKEVEQWVKTQRDQLVSLLYWVGGTNVNGWVWSDGTPVEQWIWAANEQRYVNRNCMASHANGLLCYTSPCDGIGVRVLVKGLCELDIV